VRPGAHQALWRAHEWRLGLGLCLLLAGIAVAVHLGWLAPEQDRIGGDQWAAASAEHWFGTNRLGQDIFARALAGTETAIRVGTLVTVSAVLLGALLGGIAGWRQGSWLDEVMQYVMGVLDSIPIYLLAAVLAFAFGGGTAAMVLAMVLSFWTSTARLVRAEVARLGQREFIMSARAIGLPARAILRRHLLPNTVHILLVQATLTFVAAIKTEVILSFLGIGSLDSVSWGGMLAESTQDILAGHFGNFVSASLFLFLLLLGLNLLNDALQDAYDLREPAR
jgi:ABC-type dipeptide/oligopeptide/nickel transport system permease subunit